MIRRSALAVDLPPRQQQSPEQRFWLALLERWWLDVTDITDDVMRSEASACLRPGYSPRFEFACQVCGLDLDALRCAVARVHAGQYTPRRMIANRIRGDNPIRRVRDYGGR